MAPRKTAQEEICPKDKLHPRYFPARIRNRSTLIDAASYCFPSLWFKLELNFDFCIRKKFINTVRLKLLKKEEQVKNKLSVE